MDDKQTKESEQTNDTKNEPRSFVTVAQQHSVLESREGEPYFKMVVNNFAAHHVSKPEKKQRRRVKN